VSTHELLAQNAGTTLVGTPYRVAVGDRATLEKCAERLHIEDEVAGRYSVVYWVELVGGVR